MASKPSYETLAETAKRALKNCEPVTKGSNDPDGKRILSNLAPGFWMDFGHKFFVSTVPHLLSKKDGPGFVSHLSNMAASLQTWSIDITNIAVDVEKRTVILRADFHMVPKGGQDEVLNDIMFWIVMDETGEKVANYVEFVDPVASMELAKRMKVGGEQ